MKAEPLPDPPLPDYVDLRRVETMPIKVRAVRASKMTGQAPAEIFRALTILSCASWHQVPAGSLPNDEQEIAGLAGFSQHLGEWQEVCRLACWNRALESGQYKIGRRTVEGVHRHVIHPTVNHRQIHRLGFTIADLLHEWELFADGRWYNRDICEAAVEAWNDGLRRAYEMSMNRRGPAVAEGGTGLKVSPRMPTPIVLRWPGYGDTPEFDSAKKPSQVVAAALDPDKVLVKPMPITGLETMTTYELRARAKEGDKEAAEVERTRAAVTADTWSAYSTAFFRRYQVDPPRNAMVNAQLAQFIRRIGVKAAPSVATYYLDLNNRFYVEKMHSVGPMVRDAEALYVLWTKRSTMTATQAASIDRRQAGEDAFQAMIAEAEKKEHKG